MSELFEPRLVHNPILGAELLWASTAACAEATSHVRAAPFLAAYIVLPIAFHRRFAFSLAKKTSPGAMQKALAEEPSLSAGVQRRMEAMAGLTDEALAIALTSGLLMMEDHSEHSLYPARTTAVVDHDADDVRTSMAAARRIGLALAEMDLPRLCGLLGLRY